MQLQRGGGVWPPVPHFLLSPGLTPQQSHREGRRLGCRLAPSSTGPRGEGISLEGPVPSRSGGSPGPVMGSGGGVPITLPSLSWCQPR